MRLSLDVLNKDPPAECSQEIQKAVQVAARSVTGLRSKHMVSHAYHDSLFVAQVVPTGMLFIPCFNGYSHRPDEYSSPEHMQKGVKVLALTLAQLSDGSAPPILDDISEEL